MAIMLGIVNHNQLFRESAREPIILNELDTHTEDAKNKVTDRLRTNYEGDALEIMPMCECGNLQGGKFSKMVCDVCGYTCESVIDRKIESSVWMAPPPDVTTFIHPIIWVMLSKMMTFTGFNVLEYLTNPTYQPAKYPEREYKKLKNLNFPRGINYFHKHFDEIIKALMDARLVNVRRADRAMFWQFINENRDAIFSQHLPLPAKVAFITEQTSVGLFTETATMTPAFDAIRTVQATERPARPLSLAQRQARAVWVIQKMAQYYMAFFGKPMGAREGWMRKHVFGSRLYFTFRAVISSLSDPHDYETVHLPWSLSVLVFKAHIQNKLMARGFSPKETARYINEHTLKYDKLLDDIFKELIAESPHGGIPIILQRNPTLHRLSAQRLIVRHIKTDPNDITTSLSVLVLKGPNADFDGDALNGMIILDTYMFDKLQRIAPHLGVFDLLTPHRVSGKIDIPGPVKSTIAAWMRDG